LNHFIGEPRPEGETKMRRHTLFYRIFKEFPELLFQLTGDPPQNVADYRFNSVAVKEPTFTIDGVFEPLVLDGTGTMYIAEVQMQLDPKLYDWFSMWIMMV
jgi:predicted transposase YdaD